MKHILLSAITLIVTQAFGQNFRGIQNIGVGEVSVIEFAPNSDSWVGTKGDGVYFYKDSISTWFHYNMANTSSLKSDTITSIITTLLGGEQHAFIGTTNGLVYAHAGIWDTLGPLPDPRVAGIMYRPDSIWVISVNGIANFDSTKAHRLNYSPPLAFVTAVETGGGNCHGYWVGTANNGCFGSADGTTFKYIDTSAAHSQMVDNRVNAVTVDNQCIRKIVGTKGGLSLCPTGGVPCQNFTTANGLPQNDVTAVAEGCNNNIWVGTRDSGVLFYNNSTFTRITTDNGLTVNQITSINISGPACTVWVGMTDGNIAQLDSNNNVVAILSGVDNVSKTSYSVHVFPQPSSNQLNFIFESELMNAELNLVDISGRQVQSFSVKNSSNAIVDVSNLAGGIYSYELLSSGQILKTGKVVVVK